MGRFNRTGAICTVSRRMSSCVPDAREAGAEAEQVPSCLSTEVGLAFKWSNKNTGHETRRDTDRICAEL